MKRLLLALLVAIPCRMSAMNRDIDDSDAVHLRYDVNDIKKMLHNTDSHSKDYKIVYEDGMREQLSYDFRTGEIAHTIIPKTPIANRAHVRALHEMRGVTTDTTLLIRFNRLWDCLPAAKKVEADAQFVQ